MSGGLWVSGEEEGTWGGVLGGFRRVEKAFHWLCLLGGEGDKVLSRRLEVTAEGIRKALDELLVSPHRGGGATAVIF